MPQVRYFMGDDEMVLGIYGGLDVISHHPGATTAGCHRARIRIGQRDLLIRGRQHPHFELF
jgi:hypothetical protein